jgi:hypothetical protein
MAKQTATKPNRKTFHRNPFWNYKGLQLIMYHASYHLYTAERVERIVAATHFHPNVLPQSIPEV